MEMPKKDIRVIIGLVLQIQKTIQTLNRTCAGHIPSSIAAPSSTELDSPLTR